MYKAVPANFVLAPGETLGLSALAFDQDGREIENATITWQALDSRAGTMTPRGVFRAGFETGTFDEAIVVTAKAPAGMGPGIVQGTATVSVQEFQGELRPTNIRVFPETPDLEPGESVQLVALAVDPNGVAIPNVEFKWKMLEFRAGAISQDGRLTAGESMGDFASAIEVSVIPADGDEPGIISTNVNVRVVDPASVAQRFSATVLPQVISLAPEEEMRFTTLLLDRRGNQLSPVYSRWQVSDATAGIITRAGKFKAGAEPGIYPDAVHVSIGLPDVDDLVTATATVIIVDLTSALSPEPAALKPRVAIFPDRVVLSPGESTRVSIIGLGGTVRSLSSANITWRLNPPEVGDVSQFVTVTAHDFPGVYEGAITAQVTLDTDDGPVIQDVSATLVIRGPLDSVEITPRVHTLAIGDRIQFRAVGYDENRVLLPDVSYQWNVVESTAGSIDENGVFTATGSPGKYAGAVEVLAVQRQPVIPP